MMFGRHDRRFSVYSDYEAQWLANAVRNLVFRGVEGGEGLEQVDVAPPASVTREGIEAKIKDVSYVMLDDGRTTICQLTMHSGFTVIGTSSCVSRATFDPVIGEDMAFKNAFDKLWELEGYLLKEDLYRAG